VIGVFGISRTVQQRRREFASVSALGATADTVMRQVLWSASRLVGIGAIVGFMLAVVFAKSIVTFPLACSRSIP
jgi:ABC-type antimicrobial peptide transport system permease subunit